MGMDSFAPGVYPDNGSYFWVQNIANPPKCVEIFNYPVAARGGVRNLMLIPGVGEQDIKESLLKGSLRNKLLVREIAILASNIDLLQFNTTQIQFLYNNGIVVGVQIDDRPGGQTLFTHYIDIELLGAVNNVNTTFILPNNQAFVVDVIHNIVVYKNGVKQVQGDDYTIAMGSYGWNTVIFTLPPDANILPADIITADYFISNIP